MNTCVGAQNKKCQASWLLGVLLNDTCTHINPMDDDVWIGDPFRRACRHTDRLCEGACALDPRWKSSCLLPATRK